MQHFEAIEEAKTAVEQVSSPLAASTDWPEMKPRITTASCHLLPPALAAHARIVMGANLHDKNHSSPTTSPCLQLILSSTACIDCIRQRVLLPAEVESTLSLALVHVSAKVLFLSAY